MKVLFLTNIPSPYLVEFFNLLGEHVDLTVLFERKHAADRPESWKNLEFKNFKALFPFSFHVGTENGLVPNIAFHLKRSYDIIIFGNFTTPTGILGVRWMKLNRRPYILASEGGLAKDGKGFKEKIKKWVIKDAPLILSGCEPGDNYFITYGANKSNIRRIPFTTLFEKDIVDLNSLESERKRLRKEYQISDDEFVVMTVGQYIPRKSIETLINVSLSLDKKHKTWIIGEGPLREDYRKMIENNGAKHIEILDQMTKTELLDRYKAADLFVLPTLYDSWGLVILEAMSQGLPVITTKTCVAGQELIKDEINGYLINQKDEATLKDKIEIIMNDEKLRLEMQKNNLEQIKWQTFENMLIIYLKAFDEFISNKKK